MAYTPKEIAGFNQKDRRISFLSIFSSLMRAERPATTLGWEATVKIAFEVNEKLYLKYPFPGVVEKDLSQEEADAKTTPF